MNRTSDRCIILGSRDSYRKEAGKTIVSEKKNPTGEEDADLWEDARCIKCHVQIHPSDLVLHSKVCKGLSYYSIEQNRIPFTRREPQLSLYPSGLNSSVTTIQRGETAMPGKWKKRESGGTWPPKDVKSGASIEGMIVNFEENANATAENPLRDIILNTPKGEVRVWGSAILQRKIREEDKGKEVRITYKGLVKVKRGKAKDFEIEVKE